MPQLVVGSEGLTNLILLRNSIQAEFGRKVTMEGDPGYHLRKGELLLQTMFTLRDLLEDVGEDEEEYLLEEAAVEKAGMDREAYIESQEDERRDNS
jgi:hypothetical protein